MAAASPRKCQRTKGRHRRSAKRTHWLGVGALGVGLAAALVGGGGVAGADTGEAPAAQGADSDGDGVDGKRGAVVRRSVGAVGGVKAGLRPTRLVDTGDITGDETGDDTGGDVGDDVGGDVGLPGPDDLDDPGLGGGAVDPDPEPDLDPDPDPEDAGPSESPEIPEIPEPSDTGSGPGEDQGGPSVGSDGWPAAQIVDLGDGGAAGNDGESGDGEAGAGQDTPPPAGENGPGSGSGEVGEQGPGPVDVEISDEDLQAAEAMLGFVREILRQLGLGGEDAPPTSPIGVVLQAIWTASRRGEDTWAAAAAAIGTVAELLGEGLLVELGRSIGWIPGVGTVLFGVGALLDAGALGAAVLRGDVADIADEFQDLVRDLIGMIPVVGAPTAVAMYQGLGSAAVAGPSLVGLVKSGLRSAPLSPLDALFPSVPQTGAQEAAATPEPGSLEWYHVGYLQWMRNRLQGWPGAPWKFTDITQQQTDYTLDNANQQLENLIGNAAPGSPARWVPDLVDILGMFFVSAVPGYGFTGMLNAWGDYLNRVAPAFEIAPGAGTLGIITPYKLMGAAVVGVATVLKDFLNGNYDPVQIEIDIIKATTGANVTVSDLNDFDSLLTKVAAAQAGAIFGGDGGAFEDPARAWNITLPTWTAEQVNPFTLVTYVGLVAVYKRFQELARFTTFTTWTTYDSWHYTVSVFGAKGTYSQYSAGTFHVVDDLGRPVTWTGVSQGGTYTSIFGALVTINTDGGGFTYTATLPGTSFFHRHYSENPEDRYDIVYIPVRSADGVVYTVALKIDILPGDGENTPPTANIPTVGTPDALGVVRGKITGSDADGDPLTFRLVGSSVTGLNGNMAYTTGGGIIILNPTTGDFTYISSANAGPTQSFQVEISDGHYGRDYVNVTVPNVTAPLTPTDVTKPTYGVFNGRVPIPGNDAGLFSSFTLVGNPAKGTVTAFDPVTGAFTYVRDAGLGRSTTVDDVVTVLATTADGYTVTLKIAVAPDVPNGAPSLTLTTAPTVGTLSGTTQTSTGKLTFSDPDGDAPIWPGTITTARGATVTINADGTFTYVSNFSAEYRHEVARIGAAGTTYNGISLAAYQDAFTVTVTDGYGGSATLTVVVPIYAINQAPTISGYGNATCAFGVCTRGTMGVGDPDGDSIPNNRITPGTGAGWTLQKGSLTVWGSGTTTISWDAGGTLGTRQTTNTFTVYDGYWRVVDGVVQVGDPSRAWVTWQDGGGTSYGRA